MNEKIKKIGQTKTFSREESLKVKGVAICLLLFHHLFYSQNRIDAGRISFLLLSKESVMIIATCARVCVWIFAFLSAYGLSVQYTKLGNSITAIDRSKFVWVRWLSLMKQYWFIYIICFFLSLFLFRRPWDIYKKNIGYMVLDAFGWADFFGTPSLMNVWWYLSFAQLVVLFVPLISEITKLFGCLTPIMTLITIQFLDTNSHGILSRFGGAYLSYFLIVILGIWFAQAGIMDKLGNKRSRHWILQVIDALLLFAIIGSSLYLNYKKIDVNRLNSIKVFMTVGAILIVVVVYKYFSGEWVKKVLCFLGKYSGAMFFLHGFGYTYYLQQIYWSHNVILTWLTLLVLTLTVAIIVGKLKCLIGRIPYIKEVL